MAARLIEAALLLWLAGGIAALAGGRRVARGLIGLGCLAGIAAAIAVLPGGVPNVVLPTSIAGEPVRFMLAPDALWLMGFGLAPAALAMLVPSPGRASEGGWLFGVAVSLLGAVGVFGLQNGAGLIVGWETMGLGGGIMLMSERLGPRAGRSVLLMLGLLEVGTVAMIVAVVLLAAPFGLDFAGFPAAAEGMGDVTRTAVWLLLIVAFGAKLGLLPFHEWFPEAYGAGSGASGAVLSGVVLNAAFFGLGRGLLEWMPPTPALGVVLVLLATATAIVTALYAFQEDDWRRLLSFSSAENAAIAAAVLGAAILFAGDGEAKLAGLAWTVALVHLAGHALAKGTLFLAADGVARATGSYAIRQTSLLRRTAWAYGLGALFAAASLSAMPPQAGFVSEWYAFQTVFQGFHLSGLGGRLTLVIAGAGLALTAAIALATFVKLFGIGLLGRSASGARRVGAATSAAVATLGLGVLALAVGMPRWLAGLGDAVFGRFGADAVGDMVVGWVLVPATGGPIAPDHSFAFISPSLLVIAMPLLALLPLSLLVASRAFAARRVPVWYGGFDHPPARASTTGLTFSNALRTFYALVYRPEVSAERETGGTTYFVRRLTVRHGIAPIFEGLLFDPAVRATRRTAAWLARLQSGSLNFYLALVGLLLALILGLSLFPAPPERAAEPVPQSAGAGTP